MSYYGSRFGGNPLSMFPPVTKWLLGINVLIFLLDHLILPGLKFAVVEVPTQTGVGYISYLSIYGRLWPVGLEFFGVWQYFSYMFLHADFTHILFNMLMLWMFGVELEQMWGSKRFLLFYLACGLGAAIVHSIIMMILGDQTSMLGASGAIMGVMLAFGLTFSDRMLLFMFFIPMKAKYAVLLLIGLDLYFGITGSNAMGQGNVAHFAHLGGALVGFLLLKLGSNNVPFPRLADGSRGSGIGQGAPFTVHTAPSRPPQDPQVIDVRYRDVQQNAARAAAPSMNFGDDQARIDAILDKISVSGYQNLTEEEKTILQEASKKMR